MMFGMLRAQFTPTGQMTLLEITATEHSEMIPREKLLRTAADSPEMKQSPTMSKNQGKGSRAQGKGKAAAAPRKDGPSLAPIPPNAVNYFGITNKVLGFFEVSIQDVPGSHYNAPYLTFVILSLPKPSPTWPH